MVGALVTARWAEQPSPGQNSASGNSAGPRWPGRACRTRASVAWSLRITIRSSPCSRWT